MTEEGRAALNLGEFATRYLTLIRTEDWRWKGQYRLHASFDDVEIDDLFEVEVEVTPRRMTGFPYFARSVVERTPSQQSTR